MATKKKKAVQQPKKEVHTNRPEIPQLEVIPARAGNAEVVAVQILAKINSNICVLIDEVKKLNGRSK